MTNWGGIERDSRTRGSAGRSAIALMTGHCWHSRRRGNAPAAHHRLLIRELEGCRFRTVGSVDAAFAPGVCEIDLRQLGLSPPWFMANRPWGPCDCRKSYG